MRKESTIEHFYIAELLINNDVNMGIYALIMHLYP